MNDPTVPQDAKNYAVMVSMIDRQLGQVLALLKKTQAREKHHFLFYRGQWRSRPLPFSKTPRFFGPNPQTKVEFRGGKATSTREDCDSVSRSLARSNQSRADKRSCFLPTRRPPHPDRTLRSPNSRGRGRLVHPPHFARRKSHRPKTGISRDALLGIRKPSRRKAWLMESHQGRQKSLNGHSMICPRTRVRQPTCLHPKQDNWRRCKPLPKKSTNLFDRVFSLIRPGPGTIVTGRPSSGSPAFRPLAVQNAFQRLDHRISCRPINSGYSRPAARTKATTNGPVTQSMENRKPFGIRNSAQSSRNTPMSSFST